MCYYNTSLHSSDNASCFHISFSFTDVGIRIPTGASALGMTRKFDRRSVYRPPLSLRASAHTGVAIRFPYNNFTNYAVSICERQEIHSAELAFWFCEKESRSGCSLIQCCCASLRRFAALNDMLSLNMSVLGFRPTDQWGFGSFDQAGPRVLRGTTRAAEP